MSKNELNEAIAKSILDLISRDDDVARAIKSAVERVSDETGELAEAERLKRFKFDTLPLEIEKLGENVSILDEQINTIVETIKMHQEGIKRMSATLDALIKTKSAGSVSVGLPDINTKTTNKPN